MKHPRIAVLLVSSALIPILTLTPACGRSDRETAAQPEAVAVSGPAVRQLDGAERPIIGVKIYEASPPFDELFRGWRDLGVNTLFVSEALLSNADFRARARTDRLKLFLIYPVFQSPEAVRADPGIAAVTADGRPAREEWVEFVCPTKGDAYLESRIANLRRLVAEGRPDFVSLDFIRFFVFWEMVAPDRAPGSLPQTCFCPLCLRLFQNEFGVKIPDGLTGTPAKAKWILEKQAEAWAEWKCGRIANAVKRLADAAREGDPSVKINLHAVPWRRADFGGAIRAVAGQDFARLAPLVDVISPMCYHHMVRQTPAWVHDVVEDLSAQTNGAPILPSIQVSEAYIKEKLSPDEFRAALDEALKPPSRGVVLWSWDALAKSPEKQALLKRLVH